MKMNRRIECRSEGCNNEVLFKTIDGASLDGHSRRASGGRSPLSPTDRASPMGSFQRHSNSSIQVSPYCKQHTCVHFHGDERCIHKKAPHDTVCPIHIRCPVQNCVQARAQFLDPSFDPLSNAIPRYARYEVCPDHKCSVPLCPGTRLSPRTPFCHAHACQAEDCAKQRQDQRNCCEEHQCRTRGCRTIVEGQFPYCAIHIKCEMNGCGEAKRLSDKTGEYLAYCANHAACFARRCTATKIGGSPFCENHTCRERDCVTVASAQRYCVDHRCDEPSCQNPRARASNPDGDVKFCPLHTCRADNCHDYVDKLSLFCSAHGCSKPKCHQQAIFETLCPDHLKAHYVSQGKRQVQAKRQRPRPATSQDAHESDNSDLDSAALNGSDQQDGGVGHHDGHEHAISHRPEFINTPVDDGRAVPRKSLVSPSEGSLDRSSARAGVGVSQQQHHQPPSYNTESE